jgi:DNA polymerase-1
VTAPLIAIWDIESNGLLEPKKEKDGSTHPPMDRVHTVTIIFQQGGKERRISACDQPGYEKGKSERGWERMPIVDALRLLETADLRVAHNGQGFDEPAIRLVYPWFKPKAGSRIADTLIMSRAIYPDIYRSGPNSHKVFGFLKSAHSLKAWGMRLGEHKGDYSGGWAVWSEEMQDYGEQDTVVLSKLFYWLMAQKPSALMLQIEHGFAQVIRRQEARGICFDHAKAVTLLAALTEREQTLEASLIETFGSWWEFGKPANSKAGSGKDGSSFDSDDEDDEDPEVQEERRQAWLARQQFAHVVIPTASRKVKMDGFPDVTIPRVSPTTGKELKPYVGPPFIEYTQGNAYTPIKRVEFNPSSRTHIRKRLIAMYGWEPVKFTKGGTKPGKDGRKKPPEPVVDDDVLMGLPWPEAQLLAEYYLVLKRIGMLATGKKAWMAVARETTLPNGKSVWRIHGRVNTNGAVTGRCTHSDPNMAQVPKNTAGVKQYPDQWYLHGVACRDLFIPGPGYELVGFDGSSLELCMEAHYVEPWDKGAYAKTVSEGRKEDGTDPHSFTRDLIGVNILGPADVGRDRAKTAKYAKLYGAGAEKMGSIILPHGTKAEKIEIGKVMLARMANFEAEAQLQAAIETDVETNGSMKGLDGRTLRVRKAHAALNTLLQSAGAVVMKLALIILDKDLQDAGMVPGKDYEFVANVHDEAQAEVLPHRVETYMRLAEQALPQAGKQLGLKCPLKAEASSGNSWAATH